jgi:8-oxo-dGTP pyrophosphatase MutT (NUDIX family)
MRHRRQQPAVTQPWPQPEIFDIDRVEIAIEPWSWPFAAVERAVIERHFADLQRRSPEIWNGRVLLLSRYAIAARSLRGTGFETDYASFITWRDRGFPDRSVHNFFAAAALRGADGAYLVGEMGPHTANAGGIYFPCGTPEPSDIGPDNVVDVGRNVARELLEETGLAAGDLLAQDGWSIVVDRCYIGLIKRFTAAESAQDLRARIVSHLATEERPELSNIHIVRRPADLHPQMPPAVVAFLQREWRR